jgi:hypothetical protein
MTTGPRNTTQSIRGLSMLGNYVRKRWPLLLLLIGWSCFAVSLREVPSATGIKLFTDGMTQLAKKADDTLCWDEDLHRRNAEFTKELADPTYQETLLLIWWRKWLAKIFVLIIGLTSVALAWRRTKRWKIGLAIASVSYLALAFGPPFAEMLDIHYWYGWWMQLHYPMFILPLFVERIFPLIHVFILLSLSVPLAVTTTNNLKRFAWMRQK